MPPVNYMQEIGSKCLDYWTHVGDTENGDPICQNKFNIPAKNDENAGECYDDPSSFGIKI